jgi:hypothetical protein
MHVVNTTVAAGTTTVFDVTVTALPTTSSRAGIGCMGICEFYYSAPLTGIAQTHATYVPTATYKLSSPGQADVIGQLDWTRITEITADFWCSN